MEMIYIALIGFYAFNIYLRYKTDARIWQFFNAGIIIYFLTEFSTEIPLLITFIAMLLYTVYDTFFSGGTV